MKGHLMPALPVELQPVFKTLEARAALSDHDISAAIAGVVDPRKKADEVVTDAMLAEAMAFDFCEDYQNAENGWGTYYGPQTIVPCEGGYREWPSIQTVSPKTLEYWGTRSTEAMHPVLKARYADLVWDLSPKVDGKRADIGCAHIAIDCYTQAIAGGLYQHRSEAVIYADRALTLAVALNDSARIATVRDAILNLDAPEASDDNGAGIAFDLLVGNKKVLLPAETLVKIIDSQERILAHGVENAEKEDGFPFSVDRAAERLSAHYRRQQKYVDLKRVAGLWARTKIAMARRVAPMLGAAWLRDVYTKLNDFGCPDEAETVAVVLRDLGKKSMDQMVQHTEKVEIPKKDVDDWTEGMLSGEVADVLMRIVREFIPDPDQIEEQLKELTKKAPLMSLLSISQVDADGRQVAKIGSVNDDLKGRVIQHMGQNLQFEGQFLHHLIHEFVARHKITAEMLLEEVSKSPLFEQSRKQVLKTGLEACLAGDHVVAAHVLIPQIEHALRLLAAGSGGTVYKPKRRYGGIQLKTLGDLLVDENVVRVLGDRVTLYFKVVFTDPRGWNLRNDLLHGIMNPDQLGWGSSERILHVILLLGSLRVDGDPGV